MKNIQQMDIKQQQYINTCIEAYRLQEAIDQLKSMAQEQQNWIISEKISEIDTHYRYMLHYFVEGLNDPDQRRVYQKLIQELYSLSDDLFENMLLRSSSSVFFDKCRTAKLNPTKSIAEFREALTKNVDKLALIDLLEEGEDKTNRITETRKENEKTIRDLYYALFISPRSTAGCIESADELLNDPLIPQTAKCMLISAITMNVLQRFDARKIDFLLKTCQHSNGEISTRAIVGIIPIFQQYSTRLQHYPETTKILLLLSENEWFNRRVVNAILGYIQAHETEKITKRLNEEIIPDMIKLSPKIREKLSADDFFLDDEQQEKNPEWQKVLDEYGLTDKVQELTDLQLSGADVFHSTFSRLKSYPFFHEMSNWFLPFDAQSSYMHSLIGGNSENYSLINGLADIGMMCNSDKYSLCFSLMMMTEQMRNMLISQIKAEGDDVKELQKDGLISDPYQEEKRQTKVYIQDLYRFFKLFSRKKEFPDVFAFPLNYHLIPAFQPIVSQPHWLEKMALYYFEKNNYPEALSAYTKLAQIDGEKSETWQKIGFCQQSLGNIQDALDAYLHVNLLNEKNTWVINRLAYCYRALKQPNMALEYYQQIEQLRPDDLNVQLQIGHCYLELKQYSKALNCYFKVELMDQHNTRAWRAVAWCALLSRKYDVARNYYARIIETKPTAHDYLNAGHVELCEGNIKQTIIWYLQALKKTDGFDAFLQMFNDDIKVLNELGVSDESIPLVLDQIRYEERYD